MIEAFAQFRLINQDSASVLTGQAEAGVLAIAKAAGIAEIGTRRGQCLPWRHAAVRASTQHVRPARGHAIQVAFHCAIKMVAHESAGFVCDVKMKPVAIGP